MKYSRWLPFFKRARAFGSKSNLVSMLEPRYLYCPTIATSSPVMTSGKESLLKSTTIYMVLETLRRRWLSLHQPTIFSTAQGYEFSLVVMRPVSDMSSESLT